MQYQREKGGKMERERRERDFPQENKCSSSRSVNSGFSFSWMPCKAFTSVCHGSMQGCSALLKWRTQPDRKSKQTKNKVRDSNGRRLGSFKMRNNNWNFILFHFEGLIKHTGKTREAGLCAESGTWAIQNRKERALCVLSHTESRRQELPSCCICSWWYQKAKPGLTSLGCSCPLAPCSWTHQFGVGQTCCWLCALFLWFIPQLWLGRTQQNIIAIAQGGRHTLTAATESHCVACNSVLISPKWAKLLQLPLRCGQNGTLDYWYSASFPRRSTQAVLELPTSGFFTKQSLRVSYLDSCVSVSPFQNRDQFFLCFSLFGKSRCWHSQSWPAACSEQLAPAHGSTCLSWMATLILGKESLSEMPKFPAPLPVWRRR